MVHRLAMGWRFRSVDSRYVRKEETGLLIEAFPRSANGFTLRLFRGANPTMHGRHIVHNTLRQHRVAGRPVEHSGPRAHTQPG